MAVPPCSYHSPQLRKIIKVPPLDLTLLIRYCANPASVGLKHFPAISLNMETLQRKSIESSRGFTYAYYVSSPAADSKETVTLLLQHGFPDDAHIWQSIILKLPQYRLIAPDMLGYGGTSKPTDPAAYEFGAIAQDLAEILDTEGVEQVVSVGHDWGSSLAQRLYAYHPERVAGLVLLNVGYILPSPHPFDLDATNAFLESVYGQPLFEYQKLLISEEGPSILKAHVDRLYDGMHGAPRGWIGELLGRRGNFKKWLLNEDNDWNVELREYAKDPQLKKRFVERFQRDGFDGPVCYYRAITEHIQHEQEKAIPKERLVVNVPVLYFGCSQDAVCRPESLKPAKEGGFLPDLEEVMLDCSHWSPLEAPGPIAGAIHDFISRKVSQ